MHRAQERQKKFADQKRRDQVFHTGDQVLLSTENIQLKSAPVRKLKRRFAGPFFVKQRIGPVAYELDLPTNWKIHPVFHTSLLRPFRTSQWTTSTDQNVGELEPENDEPYDVERLLRWRWRGPSSRRRKEFLVLWTGWSLDDASWIPAENFTSARELTKMIKRDNPVEDPRTPSED
jgi:hypothetical protein